MKQVEVKPLEIFLMNDEPFTCPQCGARCNTLADFYHTNSKTAIQCCLNDTCGFMCFEEEDETFVTRL